MLFQTTLTQTFQFVYLKKRLKVHLVYAFTLVITVLIIARLVICVTYNTFY